MPSSMSERNPDIVSEALALWQGGELAAAEEKYREALSQIPDGHPAVPHVRGQLACVLAAAGRNAEARDEYSRTLSEELALCDGENDAAVRAIRYLFSRHILAMQEPVAALDILLPARPRAGPWAFTFLEAEIHIAIGAREAAESALPDAFAIADSDEARQRIQAKLTDLVNDRQDR